MTDTPTDQPTHHATRSVTIGRIHVRSTAMRVIMLGTIKNTYVVDMSERVPWQRAADAAA